MAQVSLPQLEITRGRSRSRSLSPGRQDYVSHSPLHISGMESTKTLNLPVLSNRASRKMKHCSSECPSPRNSIETDSPSNPRLSFDPTRVNFTIQQYEVHYKGMLVVLELDGKKKTILRQKKNAKDSKKSVVRPAASLLQIVKSWKRDNIIKLIWLSDKPGEGVEKYRFEGITSRERFYEAVAAIGGGACRTLTGLKTFEDITLSVSSFSLAGVTVNPSLLLNWFPKPNIPYDVIVVGVQEAEPATSTQFFDQLQNHLGLAMYAKLVTKKTANLHIGLFILKIHIHKVCHIKFAIAKGAVALCFQFYETTLCFVNSVFPVSANPDELDTEWRECLKSLRLVPVPFDLTNYFNYVFWFGDLNYPLVMRQAVSDLIGKKDWSTLYDQYDILTKRRNNEQTFIQFKEGKINFPPLVGNSGSAARWPSRILWKSLPGLFVQQHSYKGNHELCNSHISVTSDFVVKTLLPNPSHFSQYCAIEISKLFVVKNVSNMQLHEVSVEFHADFLERPVTTVLPKVFTASDGKQVSVHYEERKVNVVLTPITTNYEFLDNRHLLVLVKDVVTGEQGQATIPLHNTWSTKAVSFESKLIDKGKVFGTLYGSVQIQFSDSNDLCKSKVNNDSSFPTPRSDALLVSQPLFFYCMSQPLLHSLFADFIKHRLMCEENLYIIQDVAEYKRLFGYNSSWANRFQEDTSKKGAGQSAEQLNKKVLEIYQKYFKPGCQYPLNVDSFQKQGLLQIQERIRNDSSAIRIEPPLNLFDEIRDMALKLLTEDAFKKFLTHEDTKPIQGFILTTLSDQF